MKRTLLMLACLLLTGMAYSQSLKKYAISNSGCNAYFFCNPGNFTVTKSQDSSDVYTGECNADGQAYGIICVKLLSPITDLQNAEDVTVSYLDFLKGQFKITQSVGYGKDHRLKGSEATRGIIDYWKDEDSNWKIKAWTNGAFIVVMYSYCKAELNENKANIFFESLSFP